ncbi:N-acetylmuramoyl-L-alanine amidase, partial [Lachnoclostridium sp. An118]|uniref:N-acetylmuramoyl-L-alanine amidase n=1 Tax=Lachnoclostridium sp. An118 TaxID=1965547 RepID=UPI000B556BAF
MNRGKRKTAWFLSIVMFLSVLFSGNVYAADDATTDSSQNNINVEAEQNTGNENGTIPEENSNIETQENPSDTEQGQQAEAAEDADQTVQDSSVQNQTETVGDNVPAEQGLINYVGVDYPYLETPADQNIVISYGDGSENVSDARLVAQKDDGNTLEMALSKKESELFLFTYSFDETASGIYKLTDFIYTQDGVEQTINLADIGIESMFGVNEEYPGYGENSEESAEEVTAQELEMSVVDVATSEVEAATADVEEAIEATEEQVDTTQVSRASRAAVTSKSDNLVVVLDPGHGGYDGGASANGLVEKNLTLKIAQYCKVELEQYNGVSVYMTRNDDRYLDIDERVNIAADTYHADVLVSIHINSASAAANGAEVYYPNANYNPSVHEPGRNLAQQIQNQLVALGLTDRGIKVRDTINDVYPDGSKQDYYGIIRYSKQHGFPGIIVEHAFISNPSDAAKLAQDSFLRQLGIADATGIANAYGLSKINVRATEKVNVSDNEKKAEVTAFVTEGKEDISKLSVAVWGNVNGQNDLRWYDLKETSNNEWKVSFDISNHGENGTYYSDLYVIRKNGFTTYLDSQTFHITSPMADVSIGAYDKASGTFELTASNIQCPSGVKKIEFPVWKEGDQAATVYWYTAKKQADGT